jgi:uncharacterized PurR-regulated membrane protein YhhQ (DUF165 family)
LLLYIVADLLTEVYGYAIARRVLWYCIFAQLLAIAILISRVKTCFERGR